MNSYIVKFLSLLLLFAADLQAASFGTSNPQPLGMTCAAERHQSTGGYHYLAMRSTSRIMDQCPTALNGHFQTAATTLMGGTTLSGPARAGASWGWSGGIEPPHQAPLGDALVFLLISSAAYAGVVYLRQDRCAFGFA